MRARSSFWTAVAAAVCLAVVSTASAGNHVVAKHGVDVDIGLAAASAGGATATASTAPSAATAAAGARGGNVQVNDPGLDHVQFVPKQPPWVLYTESETSVAASGQNVVVGYNSSAGADLSSGSFVTSPIPFSGFSNSNDGGKTWTSGFVPPLPGSMITFGDPSVGVDRHGTFYYASLGLDASFRITLDVNRSTDGGATWSTPTRVQQDDGGDKDWLAIGPDPAVKSRDNVYVTWTSFQPSGAQLRMGRSTDGGATWTTQTVYAPQPDPDPAHPQQFLQFTAPTVDPVTGFLYIPFIHFSNSDTDFIQVLVSRDGGSTFSFLRFNVPGAPDPTLLPIVQPGHLADCGDGGGIRLVIQNGAATAGRFGLPSYEFATRLLSEPAFGARNGVLYLAWSNSTSPVFGDPSSGSNILFIRSLDGGATWSSPITVDTPDVRDLQHVMPALTVDPSGGLHVAYYTQHVDGTVDVDLASSSDGGATFGTTRVTSVSSPLPPTNIPLAAPSKKGYPTVNYDQLVVPCYALGEYLSATSANGKVLVGWGDTRNTVTEPVARLDPISGMTHQQEDVFFQALQ